MGERYIIKGGTPLSGSVEIGGAKNAALALLAASIITDDEVIIENIPDVSDINELIKAIENIGATVDRKGPNTVSINGSTIDSCVVDYESMRKIRASYYLLGALLGKFGKASVALPGGCAIGERPIDLHIKAFEALGADVVIDSGMVHANADGLHGANIYFDIASVGATINAMLAAVTANGKTIIENAAKEPHVVDVANMLNSMGANIRGAGTDKIRIQGVEKLHGTEYSTIPDQIEAGTFMCACAAAGGDILIKNVIPKHLECISAKLIDTGCTIIEYDDAVRVKSGDIIKATRIKTLPYPGFPTDMQPQMGVVLSMARGNSVLTESIFENRFLYMAELARMGAVVTVKKDVAYITGVDRLSGADVRSHDLRAGAAMVIAGLAADGFTSVHDIAYVKRGYERFDEKIRGLGGQIEVVDSAIAENEFKRKCS